MQANIEAFRLPRYREIPDVGLYLEQTVQYINSYLAPLGCMEITASMVSNYVKKGLLPRPVKKRYTAAQIASLFFIAIGKNVLSMEAIGRLLAMQRAAGSEGAAYDAFCTGQEEMLRGVFAHQAEPAQPATSATPATPAPAAAAENQQILRSVMLAVAHIIYLSDCFAKMQPPENGAG
ncbi:MAG: DUF1836 domain-containing protein [Gemmiger sp.]|nr:DUF1836 domain-containing protein [Gemmiger sp.]